jgi:hypothetical protein
MSNTSLTAIYESLPKLVKLFIQIFLGAVVGGVYRIIKFTETKNVTTLIAGILNFTGLFIIFWIVDLITEYKTDRISVFAD